jgi:hypothetical protein
MSKKVEVDFALLQCLSFLASRSAIAITSDITDEQARKFIADGLDEVYDGMHDKKINFSEYSDDDLKNIGFVQHEDLMLVPIHILPFTINRHRASFSARRTSHCWNRSLRSGNTIQLHSLWL